MNTIVKTKAPRASDVAPRILDLLLPEMNQDQSPDLELLLSAWVRSKAQRSEDTAATYDSACQTFLGFVSDFGLTAEAIAAYEDAIKPLSLNTQAHHISAVKGFLSFLRRQELCPAMLLDLLVRPRVPAPDMGDILDIDEARTLVAAAHASGLRTQVAVALPLMTGLRVGEVCTARFCDLRRDPVSKEIVLYVVGKGTRSRTVLIKPELFDLLCALHGQKGLNSRCRRPLVPNRRGKAYTRFGFGKLVRALCADAGLRQIVSPHALRRTHATLAAQGGASAFDIQNSLGHVRLETSARYTKYAAGLQGSTANRLPSFDIEN
jgi:integrase/recombinase XerD